METDSRGASFGRAGVTRPRGGVIVALVVALATLGSGEASADESIRLAFGPASGDGLKLAGSLQHDVLATLAITANFEWSQRPYFLSGEFGGPDIDRRLQYFGGGVRLRVPESRTIAALGMLGVGLGRTSFPNWAAGPTDWRAVWWSGVGAEVKVADRFYVAVEGQLDFLGSNTENSLRLAIRVPLNKTPRRPNASK